MMLVEGRLEFLLNFALRPLVRFDVGVAGSGESRNQFLQIDEASLAHINSFENSNNDLSTVVA